MFPQPASLTRFPQEADALAKRFDRGTLIRVLTGKLIQEPARFFRAARTGVNRRQAVHRVYVSGPQLTRKLISLFGLRGVVVGCQEIRCGVGIMRVGCQGSL